MWLNTNIFSAETKTKEKAERLKEDDQIFKLDKYSLF